MERRNLFNYLQRIFDEGLCVKTKIQEDGSLLAHVENRDKSQSVDILAKDMDEVVRRTEEWQVGQMLLSSDDFKEVVMFLAQRKKLKEEIMYG